MKNIRISAISYEMLMELSKRNRKKAEEYLEEQIKSLYQKKK